QGSEPNPREAGRLYLKAAAKNEMRALYNAGLMYLSGEGLPQDLSKAETFFRKSAKQDYLPAILALADFYTRGGSVEPDLREAAFWYQRAAELGNVQAQFFTGRF